MKSGVNDNFMRTGSHQNSMNRCIVEIRIIILGITGYIVGYLVLFSYIRYSNGGGIKIRNYETKIFTLFTLFNNQPENR